MSGALLPSRRFVWLAANCGRPAPNDCLGPFDEHAPLFDQLADRSTNPLISSTNTAAREKDRRRLPPFRKDLRGEKAEETGVKR